jgi:hypothetical protein
MGFYWTTKFYPDVDNMDVCVTLASMDPIIEECDKRRGYVKKEELLQYFGNVLAVNGFTIGERSYLIEYIFSTLNFDSDHFDETCRLHVR